MSTTTDFVYSNRGLSDRANVVLDDLVAAKLRTGEEENLLLNLWSEVQKGHDLRHSRRCDMADVRGRKYPHRLRSVRARVSFEDGSRPWTLASLLVCVATLIHFAYGLHVVHGSLDFAETAGAAEGCG